MAYMRAYFPVNVINISQGYGTKSSTHKLSYALDLSGTPEKDSIYAPFDCKITKLYQPKDTINHANTVWLTSTKKVLCANGYYGYLTMSITHPSEITNMKLGTTYKQGEYLFKEGKTGRATGNHIHLELSKGQTAGWTLKKQGNYQEYVISNKIKPEEYLFAKENTTIKTTPYKIIKESDITYKVQNVLSEPLLIHKNANYQKNNINGKLNNGDEVLKFYNTGTMSYIYHYETLGFVASAYLKK